MKINSLYNRQKLSGIKFNAEDSLTQQHFKGEADINSIMSRYQKTGFLVDPLQKVSTQPSFGDFDAFDFQFCQNMVISAREQFDTLPSNIRRRFNNNVAELLYFVSQESNREEAIQLGLIDKVVVNEVPQNPVL